MFGPFRGFSRRVRLPPAVFFFSSFHLLTLLVPQSLAQLSPSSLLCLLYSRKGNLAAEYVLPKPNPEFAGAGL
ncbi:unnamed protein product [Victoria cruziana]